jgi:hypothetical protein
MSPLMTNEFINLISDFAYKRKELTGECSFLEYGSGYSTTFWTEKSFIDKIVSVEASLSWSLEVKEKIKKMCDKDIKKLSYNVFPVEDEKLLTGITGLEAWSNKYENKWSDYTNFAKKKFSKESFDFIIIDGHDRKRCFINCISLLKKGGMILLHDMKIQDFEKYDPVSVKIDDYRDILLIDEYINFGSGRGNIGFTGINK